MCSLSHIHMEYLSCKDLIGHIISRWSWEICILDQESMIFSSISYGGFDQSTTEKPLRWQKGFCPLPFPLKNWILLAQISMKSHYNHRHHNLEMTKIAAEKEEGGLLMYHFNDT